MSKPTNETPLMRQYTTIKQQYPDAILLFRMGDFYETFGEDAQIASRVLGIALTKRNANIASSANLAGFPHHALDTYLHKLVKAGYRVAICEQLENPKETKTIVKRGVTEIVTPGVTLNDKLLDNKRNNFLAAIYFTTEQLHGISFVDISTGEFFVAEGNQEYIQKLLQNFAPTEVVFQRSFQKQFKEIFGDKFYTYYLESWIFDQKFAREKLNNHFQTQSLKGFGVDEHSVGMVAAGATLHYLKETVHHNLEHIRTLQRLEKGDCLWMDKFTINNLEIVDNIYNTTSLLSVLDTTISPMGARLLRRWVVMPLLNKNNIQARLDTVEYLIQQEKMRADLSHSIKQCGDIERLVGKIPNKRINPREVLLLAKAQQQIASLKIVLENCESPYLQKLAGELNACDTMSNKILSELIDPAPIAANKGELIKIGVHQTLDELREIAHGGKEFLLNIQKREIENTGIASLKISFNNVFGYYLEVTNLHKDKVPNTWIRKQTLTSAERYITAELKEYEEKIMGAEEKINAIEIDLYDKLLLWLQEYIVPIQINGNILAIIDCLCCFANNALHYQYSKPVLHEGLAIALKDARHPVIERHLPTDEKYIANDIFLDDTEQQIIILTGPNMSGKSAVLRQTALITLMAHIGSFVPAASAKIPLTDKIFTRVGASDNLSGGESTFMVEMNETASIVNNLSARSLVLLDEIGRGTSTYDGIAIAWSLAEYLHDCDAKPKTLFATHYHELSQLEAQFPRIKNYYVSNKEIGNKIIFLRKLERGNSKHSFGIHVARMAGMPLRIVQRANEIMHQLEEKNATKDTALRIEKKPTTQMQLSIFDKNSNKLLHIQTLIDSIDIDRLTPVEALMKLNELKHLIAR